MSQIETITRTFYRVGLQTFNTIEEAEAHIHEQSIYSLEKEYIEYMAEKLGTKRAPWDRRECFRVLFSNFPEIARMLGYTVVKLT